MTTDAERYDYQIPMFDDSGSWGFIDSRSGEWRVEPRYDFVGRFEYEHESHDYLAPVLLRGRWGFISWGKHEEVVPLEFESVQRFAHFSGTNGGALAPAKRNGKWGLINGGGTALAPFEYDGIWEVSRSEPFFALARRGGKYGFLNAWGQEILPFEYDTAWHFGSGLAFTASGASRGYVDSRGRLQIEVPSYREGWDFHDTLAVYKHRRPIEVELGWGAYRTTGADVVEPEFEWITYFKRGVAPAVGKDGDWCLIDMHGAVDTVLAEADADGNKVGYRFMGQYYGVPERAVAFVNDEHLDKGWVMLDRRGQIVSPKVDWLHEFWPGPNLAPYVHQGSFGYVDPFGGSHHERPLTDPDPFPGTAWKRWRSEPYFLRPEFFRDDGAPAAVAETEQAEALLELL